MELTVPEKLVLVRRRAGKTQRDMASIRGVSLTRYQRWELGLEELDCKAPAIGALKQHEKCFIARRRKGLTLDQVSTKVGYCRMWVTRMEAGELDCKPLVKLYGRAAA